MDQTRTATASVSAVDRPSHRPFTVPDDLAALLKRRLSVFLKLVAIDEDRQQIRRQVGRNDDIDTEVSRQSREMQRVPDTHAAQSMQQRLGKRIEKLTDKLAYEGYASDQPHPMVQLLDLGCQQSQLFEQRDQMTGPLLEAGACCASDEPLYRTLQLYGVDPTALFGWTVYTLALERFQTGTAKKLASLQDQITAILNGPGKKKQKQQDPRLVGLRHEVKQLSSIQLAARREREAIEPIMVNEFWRVYEESALLLVQPDTDTDAQVAVRALLRYGLVLRSTWILPSQMIQSLIQDCLDSVTELDDALDATHVLYADEYIFLSARGMITPSLDEDLELNERGSEQWKLDKVWRKTIYGRLVQSQFAQVTEDLQKQIDQLNPVIERLEFDLDALDPKSDEDKPKRSQLRREIQDHRVQVARYARAQNVVDEKLLPKQMQIANDAKEKLSQLGGRMSMEDIVRRETKAIRQVCKLCARLKEPFLPLVMRDYYKPEAGVVNDRQEMSARLQEIETLDPRIFKDVLIQAKQPANRVYVRTSPHIVLAPARGATGMSWNPRGGTEVGRIVIPLLSMRGGSLMNMLYQILADFRYDTSKESAGMDLLTSDTLVAAYAAVRWNYRKRSKQARLKAAIYNEEKDRANWRRHYKLFMTSAKEGGKQLFFKCPDVYKAVLKYIGLPDGVEKLG